MGPPRRALGSPVRRCDRGAAAVEFALVASLFFLLVFGIVEVSLLLRNKLSATNAAEEAARRGAIAGDAPDADRQILDQLLQRSAAGSHEFERVIVYHATSVSAGPPSACLTATSSLAAAQCNVYDAADLSLAPTSFGSCAPGLDGGWCPTTRNTKVGETDLLGLYVIGTYASATGVIGDRTFESQIVLPLEPSGR